MPFLKHKLPCIQCPFRRGAAPGWLGAYNAASFMRSTLMGYEMPCHLTINYEREDWFEHQYPTCAICAGSLIFLSNTCTLPRNRNLASMVRQVERDKRTVFATPKEFTEHHKRLYNAKQGS